MAILQICRECGFPITSDPRIARAQAVCCCENPKGGIAKIQAPNEIPNDLTIRATRRVLGL